jgi:hypothetical protein
MEKKLAKIRTAGLGIKERGIFNFWIHVDYEGGCSQGIGGIALDTYDKEKKGRVGTAYGCEMIRRILIALNVDDFADMKGKQVWVYGEGGGLSFKPCGIGSLKTEHDKPPVMFADVAQEFGL